MSHRRLVPLDFPTHVSDSVRATVNHWFELPFSYGMRNRHAATVHWLARESFEHAILTWTLFTRSGDHLGVAIATEYGISPELPGYEVTFHIQQSQLDTTHRLVMVPRCMSGERVGVDEPFLLLLHVNWANHNRPHTPIHFANFSPAMPYWGLFHTIANDEPRIQRISAKRHNDRRLVVWQLMRQKRLPYQLLPRLVSMWAVAIDGAKTNLEESKLCGTTHT
jgi:hypothetical protein